MKESKYIVVNNETGEVMGDLSPQTRRASPIPMILLSLLLAVSVFFALRERDRAEKAIQLFHDMHILYVQAEASADHGDKTDAAEGYQILLNRAAANDYKDRQKTEAELFDQLQAIE